MAGILKTSLGLRDNVVGVKLFKNEAEIPKDLSSVEKPVRYCSMIQGARLEAKSFLARADFHECKGGAAGLGLMQCPDNISNGSLYFNKLHKCETPEVGISIASNMPRLLPGNTIATYVAPLDKMAMNPDVVVFIGNAMQARRIVQAVMFKEGGRSTFTTAGIQSLCVDATASPYLKGEVNVSLGCDGSAKNSGLMDDDVVVGIPFAMMEDICTVLKTHYEGWDKFMRG
ncbi:MAG: hypothetical protein A4E49_02558 [Methanosaeta sp. PtaU1.Bin112]|nr:MAG: hypothetical protein A4E49_02558 [Methanosaeta sp. PtaU1.Bin112]